MPHEKKLLLSSNENETKTPEAETRAKLVHILYELISSWPLELVNLVVVYVTFAPTFFPDWKDRSLFSRSLINFSQGRYSLSLAGQNSHIEYDGFPVTDIDLKDRDIGEFFVDLKTRVVATADPRTGILQCITLHSLDTGKRHQLWSEYRVGHRFATNHIIWRQEGNILKCLNLLDRKEKSIRLYTVSTMTYNQRLFPLLENGFEVRQCTADVLYCVFRDPRAKWYIGVWASGRIIDLPVRVDARCFFLKHLLVVVDYKELQVFDPSNATCLWQISLRGRVDLEALGDRWLLICQERVKVQDGVFDYDIRCVDVSSGKSVCSPIVVLSHAPPNLSDTVLLFRGYDYKERGYSLVDMEFTQ